MKSERLKKCWVTPEITVYGNVADITKGGTGWKTGGTGDDLLEQQLTPFCSTCR